MKTFDLGHIEMTPTMYSYTRRVVAFLVYLISDIGQKVDSFNTVDIKYVWNWIESGNSAQWFVAGLEAFGTSPTYFWGAMNNKNRALSVINLYKTEQKRYLMAKDSAKDISTFIYFNKSISPSVLGFDLSQKVNKDTLKINGTASWGTFLYVLVTTVAGESKIGIFDVSRHGTTYNNGLIVSKKLATSPATADEQDRIKIGVTWSHVYVIEAQVSSSNYKFTAYNKYTLEEESGANYKLHGDMSVAGELMGACLMTPYTFFSALSDMGSSKSSKAIMQAISLPIRRWANSNIDKYAHFYDMTISAKPLGHLDFTSLSDRFFYTDMDNKAVQDTLAVADSKNIIKIELSYNGDKVEYVFVLYLKRVFSVDSTDSKGVENTSLIGVYAATSTAQSGVSIRMGKALILPSIPPTLPDDAARDASTEYEVANNFTDMYLNSEGTLLYVWQETQILKDAATTYKNKLVTYSVDTVVTNTKRDSEDKKNIFKDTLLLAGSTPPKLDAVTPITKVFTIDFKVPSLEKIKSYAHYNAPNPESWGNLVLEMYRKDPGAEEYAYVQEQGDLEQGVDTVITDSDTSEKKESRIITKLYTKLPNYDGDPKFGYDTAPSARIAIVHAGRILLGDVKENAASLNVLAKDYTEPIVVDVIPDDFIGGPYEPIDIDFGTYQDQLDYLKQRTWINPNLKVARDKIVYGSSLQASGFPPGNRIYSPHNITYMGNYKSHTIIGGQYNLYRLARGFVLDEINSVVGIPSTTQGVMLTGVLLFVSHDGIYTTDGFRVNKINHHLDRYFKKNIQEKDIFFTYYALKNKVYLMYKDTNKDNTYARGVIIDLLHSNLGDTQGAYCTEYNENSYIWKGETGLLSTSWCVHKNIMYKANNNGTISFFDENTKERESPYTNSRNNVVLLPIFFTFTSGGLSFQSLWRQKHIYRSYAVVQVAQGGALHFYGIGDAGKSRVELKDIDVPRQGRLRDASTSMSSLLLKQGGIVNEAWPLGGQFRRNTFYQIGMENGLSLEHSGMSGTWRVITPRHWFWTAHVPAVLAAPAVPAVDATPTTPAVPAEPAVQAKAEISAGWTLVAHSERFGGINVTNIVPKVPRNFTSAYPFLNYSVALRNIKIIGRMPGETMNKALKTVFNSIEKQRFVLVDDCYPSLNSDKTISSIQYFNIKQSLSDFINFELYGIINDDSLFDPTLPFGPQPPDPPIYAPKHETINGVSIAILDDVQFDDDGILYPNQPYRGSDHAYIQNPDEYAFSYEIAFDFDLYSHTTIDFQLLSLTVTGGQGPSPNPAEQSNST